MLLQNQNRYNCCGCGACEQACPVGAIIMQGDAEGFLYPKIDQYKCISCNKCERVCPFQNGLPRTEAKTTFLLIDKNDERRNEASSGGAFELACHAFISDSDSFAIWGCTLDQNFKAVHTCVYTFDDIYQLKKSKYIQSDLQDAFQRIHRQLSTGSMKVVFSGTPCQTAALRLFLQREYDNLMTIDFVCHGVPSQKAFDAYIKEFEKRIGEKVQSFTFRNKDNGTDPYGVKITSSSGETYIESSSDNAFMFGYLNGFLFRPSCYNCPFASVTRHSDITIADYWGIEEYLKKTTVSLSRGSSMLLINTHKGAAIYRKIQTRDDVYTCEVPISVALKNNQNLSHNSEEQPYREKFYRFLHQYPFSEALSRSQYPPFYKRVYHRLKKSLARRHQ